MPNLRELLVSKGDERDREWHDILTIYDKEKDAARKLLEAARLADRALKAIGYPEVTYYRNKLQEAIHAAEKGE